MLPSTVTVNSSQVVSIRLRNKHHQQKLVVLLAAQTDQLPAAGCRAVSVGAAEASLRRAGTLYGSLDSTVVTTRQVQRRLANKIATHISRCEPLISNGACSVTLVLAPCLLVL